MISATCGRRLRRFACRRRRARLSCHSPQSTIPNDVDLRAAFVAQNGNDTIKPPIVDRLAVSVALQNRPSLSKRLGAGCGHAECIEVGHRLLVQLHRRGRQVLFEMLDACRPRDQQGVGRVSQQPGEADMHGRNAKPRGDLLHLGVVHHLRMVRTSGPHQPPDRSLSTSARLAGLMFGSQLGQPLALLAGILVGLIDVGDDRLQLRRILFHAQRTRISRGGAEAGDAVMR